MSDHFDTAPGWPQTRAEVEAAPDGLLDAFMGRCAVEPADFEDCLACYAYEVAQNREAARRPADPALREAAGRIVSTISAGRATMSREALVEAVERELRALDRRAAGAGR